MSRIDEIRNNAIELIALHGFGAVSLRQLAKSCGLQAGSFYAYYRSKDDLLQDLITSYLEDLQQSWQESSFNRIDPARTLADFVSHHLEFQSTRRDESLIANMDLRNLPEPGRRQISAMKACYERELKSILTSGERLGLFNQDSMTSTVILSMLTGLSLWQEQSADTSRQLIHACQRIALQIAQTGQYQVTDEIQSPAFS